MNRPRPVAQPAHPALYLASVSMADGSDINSPEARLRLTRALLKGMLVNPAPDAQTAPPPTTP